MDEATQRVLVINMAILAKADGKVDPAEVGYIKDFLARSDISTLKANGWLREAREGNGELQPIPIGEDTEDLLKLLIGVVAADRRLDKAEGEQLVRIAKACDVPAEKLANLVRKNWRRNVLDDLMPADEGHPAVGEEDALSKTKVMLATDHFHKLEEFIGSHRALAFDSRSLQDVLASKEAPEYLVFHADVDRLRSVAALKALREKFPQAAIVVLVRREQAFQIRYLIEAGAAQCLVQPIFPNELTRIIEERAR